MRYEVSPWTDLSPTSRRVAVEVLLHGPIARTDIAERLDLSLPSLTRLTKPMIDTGFLREVDLPAPRLGGRPPRPLDLDPDLHQFVGIKLAGERADAVLTNLRADILATASTTITDHEPAAVVDDLTALTRRLTPDATPTAVGVALGGVVHNRTTVVRAPFLGWRTIDLAALLRETLDAPTAISNDLEALTAAEHWFGDGRDVANFAVITIGAGVGLGLVTHSRLVTGPDSGLGLIGHFPLDPLGPACTEGHHGCADALLTIPGIRTQASLTLGQSLTYDEILDLADNLDPIAHRIIGRAGSAFGTLIAAVANIAQPQRIILTGEGIRLAQVAADTIRAGISQARHVQATDIDLRVLDDDPLLWARGAAAVVIQHAVQGDLPTA